MSQFIEALEARELLSVSPVRHPDHPAHGRAVNATIANDLALIKDARAKIPLDIATFNAILIMDRAAIPAIRADDLTIIHNDTIKLRQDQGNPTAVLADRGQLLIDRAKLKSDVGATEAKVKADLAARAQTLVADRAQIKALELKLRNDRIAAGG